MWGASKLIVLVPLALLCAGFIVLWLSALRAQGGASGRVRPSLGEIAIGVVTDFFDTLGIGSFATTTSLFRASALVPDRLLPGTLNVGHTLPTIAQAFIYVAVIEVDVRTLLLMIASAVLGAVLGAGVVSRWPERNVQLGMGAALLAAAALMLLRAPEFSVLPPGGDAKALSGWLLVLGMGGNFVLGALMTIGIGLYAPCMILVSMLGMSPKLAFPIMMGSCAFLMPPAAARFIRNDAYAPRAALGLSLGGVPAVLVAAYVVKELPLQAVRWLVLVIVIYTAVSLLRAALGRANALG